MLLRTLTQRALASPLIMAWGFYLAHAVTYLSLTMMVVTELSASEQVVWFAFASINTILTIGEFGFGPVVSRLVSYVNAGATRLDANTADTPLVGEKDTVDWPLMERLYSTLAAIYFVLSVASMVILLSFGSYVVTAPIAALGATQGGAWNAWWVVCASSYFAVLGRRYQAVLTGLGFVVVVYRWNAIFSLVTLAVVVGVFYFDGGLAEFVYASQFFHVLAFFRNRYLLHRVVLGGVFGRMTLKPFDKGIFLVAWSPAWRGALGLAGSMGVTQSIALMIANSLSSASAAPYLLALRFISLIDLVSSAPMMTRIPLINQFRVQRRFIELQALVVRTIRLSLVLFLVGTICVYVAVPIALDIAKAQTHFLPGDLWGLMTFVWLVQRHHGLHAHVYSSTNREPFYIPIICTGLFGVLLVYELLDGYGVLAVIVSQGIANAIFLNWWCVKIALQSINLKVSEYFGCLIGFKPIGSR